MLCLQTALCTLPSVRKLPPTFCLETASYLLFGNCPYLLFGNCPLPSVWKLPLPSVCKLHPTLCLQTAPYRQFANCTLPSVCKLHPTLCLQTAPYNRLHLITALCHLFEIRIPYVSDFVSPVASIHVSILRTGREICLPTLNLIALQWRANTLAASTAAIRRSHCSH